MGLFDGYFDPQTFDASGGLLGRIRSLQRQQGILPDSEFDPPSTGFQPPSFAPTPWPGSGRASSAQDWLARYGALSPVVGGGQTTPPAGSQPPQVPIMHPSASRLPSAGVGIGVSAGGSVPPTISDASPQPQRAPVNLQDPGNDSASELPARAANRALSDFYHQTIQQAGNDIVGYVHDAINDPGAFSRAVGSSLAALGPIVGELPSIIRGVIGAAGIVGSAPQSKLGDLTPSEVQQIQSAVNEAGRPLEVVGSAARGTRTPTSDIDYLVPPSSLPHYRGLQGKLPGIDPEHGIVPGVGNPEMGPIIRFEPK